MSFSRSTSVLFALAFLTAACSERPTDVEERMIEENPSFAQDIVEITNRGGCTASACHGASPPAGGMSLGDAATTYASWVDVPAVGKSGEIRVIPGNAQDSYLVKKLEGRDIAGARMPFGMAPLDDIDMGNIRNWIDNGAPNN